MLNDLLTTITELSDVRTVSGSTNDIMAKTLAAIRDVDAFTQVFLNPLLNNQALNSALRSRVFEADRA